MSAFSTWDYYNVIPEHFIEALQTDSVIGSGGADEVKTWEQERREDPSEYNDHELPAVAVEVTSTSQEVGELSGHCVLSVGVLVLVTTGGFSDRQTVMQTAKRIQVRIERNLRQQNRTAKQISDLPTDIEGAVANGIKIRTIATESDGGAINNVMRGVAGIASEITIDFTPTID